MRIAVDIDGILTKETEGWDYVNRTPRLVNVNQVNALFEHGHTIILYTARLEVDRQVTVSWLHRHKIKYHELVMGKLQYDLLIDDRALPDFHGQVSMDGNPWIVLPWEADHPAGVDSIQQNIVRQLEYIGEDPNREGLLDTPKRIVKSWDELFAGYNQDPKGLLRHFDAETYDQIVLLKDIELYSMCEHHMLPFTGIAHVAYIPDKRVIGISKLARLVDIYARRLQIQERIGEQVTGFLMEELGAQGAACIIEASHMCMRMRGCSKQRSTMVTSSLKGVFIQREGAQNELMQLIRG